MRLNSTSSSDNKNKIYKRTNYWKFLIGFPFIIGIVGIAFLFLSLFNPTLFNTLFNPEKMPFLKDAIFPLTAFWLLIIVMYKHFKYYGFAINDEFLTVMRYEFFKGQVIRKIPWNDLKLIKTESFVVHIFTKHPYEFQINIRTANFNDLLTEIIHRAVNAEIDEETRKLVGKLA